MEEEGQVRREQRQRNRLGVGEEEEEEGSRDLGAQQQGEGAVGERAHEGVGQRWEEVGLVVSQEQQQAAQRARQAKDRGEAKR